MSFLSDNPVTGWKFLNEPMYSWFIFLLALSLMAGAWKIILDHMK
jgi:hypothetical protein